MRHILACAAFALGCSPIQPLSELRPIPPLSPPSRAVGGTPERSEGSVAEPTMRGGGTRGERVWQIPEVTVVGHKPRPRSRALRNAKLFNPLPGGFIGGWYGDTGLDISASFRPVYALASGTLEYSERGHTLWTRGKDTPYSVRLRLDEPIPYKGHLVTHVYYTHLSALEYDQPERASFHEHVEGGEQIGTTGIGNGVPHLHLGLLLDDHVDQDAWDTLLVEGDIRAVLGGYRNGEAL